jgi:hypothetical protein
MGEKEVSGPPSGKAEEKASAAFWALLSEAIARASHLRQQGALPETLSAIDRACVRYAETLSKSTRQAIVANVRSNP